VPDNKVQTSVTTYTEKNTDGVFELVQKSKQLACISGNENIGESSDSGGKTENNQIFHNVGYLEFDKKTKLSVILQALRSETVALGSCHSQNRGYLPSVTGECSITLACYGQVKENISMRFSKL